MIRNLCFAPLVILACLAIVAPLRGADDPPQVDVFRSGEGGYHTYRIPAAIVSPKGTLLALCEGRKANRSDTGDIDLVLRRSFDGGDTWQDMQVVWDDGAHTCGNPCPVVERETGRIWLLLTHNLGQDTEEEILTGQSEGTRTCWIAHSDDDGATWSKPRNITADVKRPDWTWYATGPGVGIQTRGGRVIIPCDNYVAGTKAKQSHVIYSDDKGETWKIGGIVGPDCNECQIAELSDGRLQLNMRSYRPGNLRAVAESDDGGLTFGRPRADRSLREPICQASLLRVKAEPDVLLFSNPSSTKRESMTVKRSADDGKLWSPLKVRGIL